MKFGVNLMVWTTRVTGEHAGLLSRIQEWGFDGVELLMAPNEPSDLRSVRRMLDRVGLERTSCTVLARENHLVSDSADVRSSAVRFLITCVERTAELGSTLICGPLYAGLGVMTGARRTADEWNRAVDGLQQVARRAEPLGVTLCLEPLNRFETYFLNTLEDASKLVHAISQPNVKIHFDTFHANIEECNPAAALRSVREDLGHVHISENDRGVPGTGHVPWREIVSTLKETSYDGWLTIESFARPEPELASAASIWRDVAPSGDELAVEGLRFIKGLVGPLGTGAHAGIPA